MGNKIKFLISHNFLQTGQCEAEQTKDKYKNTLNKNLRTVKQFGSRGFVYCEAVYRGLGYTPWFQ